MWLNLLGLGIKTGAKIYANNKATKVLESEAKRKHYEKMASGEIEYRGQILNSQDKGFKDEFVLILVSLPIILLGYSVFSDSPDIRERIDLFFEYFKNLPMWYQLLFVGICSAIYGLRGADIMKKK
jgi:hypothetical protein